MKRTHSCIHPTVAFFFGCLVACTLGCTKPQTDIGLGLQPNAELLDVSVVDTLTLTLHTVREDSLETSELSTGLVGRVFVPRFGWVEAALATQLRLSAPDVSFGTQPVADSLFLQIRWTGDVYGQPLPQQFSVQPLANGLDIDSAYYSNQWPATTGEEWVMAGSGPWNIEPNADLVVGDDTLSPQLRLPLSVGVGQTLLELDTATFDDNASWTEYLPGILVRHAGGGHGIGALDISSGLSVMRLHYHNETDTTFYDFLISPLSARINVFSHHWMGELAQLQVGLDSLEGRDKAFVLSASGCKTRLRIPHLASLKDSLEGDLTVLKAELVLPVDEHVFNKRFAPQDQLFVLMKNAAGNNVSTPDQTSPISINGNYDAASNRYVFNLSSTVQGMLNGELSNPDLYIVSNRAGISVAGVVLEGTDREEGAHLVLTIGH